MRQRIHIETFQNRTNQELLEALVTNAIVFEFTKRSENIIVDEPPRPTSS